MLKDVPEERRSARFRCCIALASPTEEVTLFEATCEGVIAKQPSGGGGFGYDPIFYLPEMECTMADLTVEQKHEISHRGKVLRLLSAHLETVSEV
jgi:XTP/dITP diphosphohydrolase